jgi:hypothetical protein
VNAGKDKPQSTHQSLSYWHLWIFNAVMVGAGVLFFLAAQYGTYEFFGRACLMALLPFIPVMVLVGGAGSTIFVLTKVKIEKRSIRKPAALALLLGPGVLLTLLLVLLGVTKSNEHRLAYICAGNAPPATGRVRVAGYSTFLREEWLAVFHVEAKDFQAMITKAQLVPADGFEFRKIAAQSSLQSSKLFQNIPATGDLPCFKRVFKPGEEHQRGSVYALFDPATSTAVVIREIQD